MFRVVLFIVALSSVGEFLPIVHELTTVPQNLEPELTMYNGIEHVYATEPYQRYMPYAPTDRWYILDGDSLAMRHFSLDFYEHVSELHVEIDYPIATVPIQDSFTARKLFVGIPFGDRRVACLAVSLSMTASAADVGFEDVSYPCLANDVSATGAGRNIGLYLLTLDGLLVTFRRNISDSLTFRHDRYIVGHGLAAITAMYAVAARLGCGAFAAVYGIDFPYAVGTRVTKDLFSSTLLIYNECRQVAPDMLAIYTDTLKMMFHGIRDLCTYTPDFADSPCYTLGVEANQAIADARRVDLTVPIEEQACFYDIDSDTVYEEIPYGEASAQFSYYNEPTLTVIGRHKRKYGDRYGAATYSLEHLHDSPLEI